jgi:hypothetical protein
MLLLDKSSSKLRAEKKIISYTFIIFEVLLLFCSLFFSNGFDLTVLVNLTSFKYIRNLELEQGEGSFGFLPF